MANSETNSYDLTNDDLTAFSNIVGMQGDVGAKTLTKPGLFDFAQRLYWCSYNYEKISNTGLARQLEKFYRALMATPTNFGQKVPALLVAYMWGLFQASDHWRSWYNETGSGMTWENRCVFGSFCCTTPAGPPDWKASIHGFLHSLPSSPRPPTTIIWYPATSYEAFTYRQQIIQYEYDLFDPAKWTDAAQVKQSAAGLWKAQSDDLETLTKTTPLTDQMSLYLLFLLTGLCTSPDPQDISKVYQIADLNTDSPEYPNDTLADQLVYYALMAWVDPRGNYQWMHNQLVAEVEGLAASVPNSDPASSLMRKTFDQQAAVLKSSPSYPMIDPYNPSKGFPQRKTDTLAAINKAWTTLQS